VCEGVGEVCEMAMDPEAEFLDVIGTKALEVFLLAIHSRLANGFYSPRPPPPQSKTGL
jgi:hypothetical protein